MVTRNFNWSFLTWWFRAPCFYWHYHLSLCAEVWFCKYAKNWPLETKPRFPVNRSTHQRNNSPFLSICSKLYEFNSSLTQPFCFIQVHFLQSMGDTSALTWSSDASNLLISMEMFIQPCWILRSMLDFGKLTLSTCWVSFRENSLAEIKTETHKLTSLYLLVDYLKTLGNRGTP